MKSIQEKINQYPKELVAACESALDQKLFYADDFYSHVMKQMMGHDCEAILMDVITVEQMYAAPGTFREVMQQSEDRVRSADRGHYILIENVYELNGEIIHQYHVRISDGIGVSSGTRFTVYASLPDRIQILDDMLSYDVYNCRKLLEFKSSEYQQLKLIQQNGFAVGASFVGLRSHENMAQYQFNKSFITAISDGNIDLVSSIKGKRGTYKMTTSASRLVDMIEWSKVPDELSEAKENEELAQLFA